MEYPILQARLDALEEQLDVVEQSPRWLDAMSGGGAGAELHAGLDATIGMEARNQKQELEKVRAALNNATALAGDAQAEEIRKAWTGYFRVQNDCEAIFGECLRLLGGVAIRNQGFSQILDNQIWDVADELVRSCARESIGDPWTSLTVPAPREAVARTLARMIRLRFPAWNIWTIPLAAREYGHVVAEDAAGLPDAIGEKVRSRAEDQLATVVQEEVDRHRLGRARRKHRELEDTARNTMLGNTVVTQDEANAAVQDRVADLLDRERSCQHVLVADAYATYTLGIAYACAALLLRFEPARGPRDNLISDAFRGDVVLAMLERMNAESPTSPYTAVLQQLRTGWDSVLQHATTNGAAAADPNRGKAFVDWIWDIFRIRLRPTARYPDEDDAEGWLSVLYARGVWTRSLEATDEFATDGLELRKLRDALNAAWSWRLDNPDADERKLRRLENSTMTICRNIVDEIRRPSDGRPGSSQRPGGRGRG